MTHLLEVTDLRSGYGRVQILHGLDFCVPEGSVVALLGANGAGKTTTLKALSGTLPISGGTVTFRGRRIDSSAPDRIARAGMILVPEGRGIFPAMTVEENLRLAHGSLPSDSDFSSWLAEITATFPRIGERLDQQAGSMSGGEQQMLALCRSMIGEPALVMFDELSMGLAPVIVDQLFEQVGTLRDQGRSILLVEQYLTHALALADLCYVMAKGRVTWAGEAAELRNSPTAASYLNMASA